MAPVQHQALMIGITGSVTGGRKDSSSVMAMILVHMQAGP
jgi:hypothetical protein